MVESNRKIITWLLKFSNSLKDIYENNKQQRDLWSTKFGDEYTDRNIDFERVNKLYKNTTGISLEELFKKFFDNIDRKSSILELGCNVGLNLGLLRRLGFVNLTGVEVNKKAYEIAKRNNPEVKFVNSSIEDYQSSTLYDVVFTAGVLIHINPVVVPAVVSKMISLTKNYIFGFEYFSEDLVEVNYRGNPKSLWKQNFPKLFLQSSKMEIVMEEKLPYKNQDLTDVAYLLRKSM